MKGEVLPNAVVTNKFDLQLVGAFAPPKLYAVSMGELSREVITTEMSDRTMQSTGEVKAFEFEIEVPMNDPVQLIMHNWFNATASALPGHKMAGLAFYNAASGATVRSVSLIGLLCKKEILPAMNRGEDGKQGNAKYTISVDSASIQI